MWVQSLGWKYPLEEEMSTHSSILVGKSQGQRSLSGYIVHSITKSHTWLGDWAASYCHSTSQSKAQQKGQVQRGIYKVHVALCYQSLSFERVRNARRMVFYRDCVQSGECSSSFHWEMFNSKSKIPIVALDVSHPSLIQAKSTNHTALWRQVDPPSRGRANAKRFGFGW